MLVPFFTGETFILLTWFKITTSFEYCFSAQYFLCWLCNMLNDSQMDMGWVKPAQSSILDPSHPRCSQTPWRELLLLDTASANEAEKGTQDTMEGPCTACADLRCPYAPQAKGTSSLKTLGAQDLLHSSWVHVWYWCLSCSTRSCTGLACHCTQRENPLPPNAKTYQAKKD